MSSSVEHQNLSSENLQKIQWSQTSIPLCDFVITYPLPQIVQIEEGYHDGSDEGSLSMGQVLKIHTLTRERKLVCQDRHGKDMHIPVHIQKVLLKPDNYNTVYQRVSDLSHVKPLPKYVEVTRGYCDVDSGNELTVEAGEILEVVEVMHEPNIFTKKNRSMTFRKSDGEVLKVPFDCAAGLKPIEDITAHSISDILPSDSNAYRYPFYFQFHGSVPAINGVLTAKLAYEDLLIIASCGEEGSQSVFMIPQNLKVKVKVALGTLGKDPEYENIQRSYHNFSSLESDLRKSKRFRGRTAPNASEIVVIPIVNTQQPDRVTFDTDEEDISNHDQFIRSKSATNNLDGLDESERPVLPEINNNGKGFQETTSGRKKSLEEVVQRVEEDRYQEIRNMSVQELAECLRSLNMNKRAEAFVENQVDGELFLHLEEEELKDFELTKFEIKKLFRFKEGWRPKST